MRHGYGSINGDTGSKQAFEIFSSCEEHYQAA